MLPDYIGAMVLAAVARNVDERTGWLKLSARAVEGLGGIALALFLVIALMSLELWRLAGLAVPMLIILSAQVVVMVAYAVLVTFPLMGRDYEAIRKQVGANVIVRADPTQVEEELARFAAERQVPPERARQMAIAGTPEEVAARLAPYLGLGFDMFLLLERTPLDYETLRLFMQEVAPRLRAAAGQGS